LHLHERVQGVLQMRRKIKPYPHIFTRAHNSLCKRYLFHKSAQQVSPIVSHESLPAQRGTTETMLWPVVHWHTFCSLIFTYTLPNILVVRSYWDIQSPTHCLFVNIDVYSIQHTFCWVIWYIPYLAHFSFVDIDFYSAQHRFSSFTLYTVPNTLFVSIYWLLVRSYCFVPDTFPIRSCWHIQPIHLLFVHLDTYSSQHTLCSFQNW